MRKGARILILGAGVMQLPAIRAAHRLGLFVIVADGNPDAPGKPEADVFEHVDLRDREGMLATAAKHRDRGGLDAVFTAGTDFSATVAFVTDALGLPGTSLESAERATDKFRMRQALRAAGVRVPDFAVISGDALCEESVSRIVERIGLPVVVKPADSMGARGVVRAETAEETFTRAREAIEFSRSSRVVLEGYIDGPEFSLDALVYNGTVQITGFADRHIVFPPHFIEIGHTIPTTLDPASQDAVVTEFRRAVAALGISNGAAKGDMKLSSHGPVVGEVAARLSGGYMSGWTFPLSTGIELTEKAIRIALGEPPGSLEPAWERTCAERALVSIPGVVEEVRGVEAVRTRRDVAEVFVVAAPGSRVRFPRSNVEKCANVLAVHGDRVVACREAEAAIGDMEVVLALDFPETEEFLFGSPSHNAYPDAAREAGHGRPPFTRSEFRNAVQSPNAGKPIRIAPPPAGKDSRDWSWRTLERTVRTLEADGLVRLAHDQDEAGRMVWQAIARGGLQGGRYAARMLAGR